MKIKTFLVVYFVIMLCLGAIDFGITHQLEITENEIQKAEQNRQDLLDLTDELRMSSEFLTRFSRNYVVTRDEKVLNYYNNILDIRDGKISRPDNYNNMYWDLVATGVVQEPNSTKIVSPSFIE